MSLIHLFHLIHLIVQQCCCRTIRIWSIAGGASSAPQLLAVLQGHQVGSGFRRQGGAGFRSQGGAGFRRQGGQGLGARGGRV